MFEGADYYHFGFRSEADCHAAWKRLNDYQDQVMDQAATKPWLLLIWGLERGGPSRWLVLAAGAFVLGRAMATQNGKEVDLLMMKFVSREEARAAGLRIRSAAEFKADIKLTVKGPPGEYEEVEPEAIL